MALEQPIDATGLAARFTDPDTSFGPVPIWWWSGAPLRNDRLRWQMEQLLAGGIHQAVVMCLAPRGPLYGSLADEPAFLSEPWWEVFLQACQDASELGFRFWLYDQYGFSGANFQGQLVAAQSAWAGQELERTETEVRAGEAVRVGFPAGALPLAAYFAAEGAEPLSLTVGPDAMVSRPGDEQSGRLCLCFARTRGFDYYDRDACAALIDVVLGEFRRRADKWFGPVITGLFQDELPHMPTWGKGFADSFVRAHGYDLREHIAALWEGAGDEAATVRHDYHALRAELARESFFEPYGSWADDAGLVTGFDQQTPAREGDPASATQLYGDYLGTHAVFSAPGSDHWGDPKVHSSLAHANGHPRTWIEAFHSSGWGGTLEETYDWLGPFLRRGANLYDPHAVYYSTAGGWWEWAPPSTCWRQPYWPDYRVFADAVTRLCALTTAGQLVADTVLLFPTSSVQADSSVGALRAGPAEQGPARHTSDIYHRLNGSSSWLDQRPGILDRAHHDYEIFDERTLRSATVTAGTWQVGNGVFRNLVLPAVTALDADVAERIAEFVSSGGRVVAVGALPTRFTGAGRGAGAGAALHAVAGEIHVVATAEEVPDHLLRGPWQVDSDTPFMLRRCGDALVLLLVAHDAQTGTQMPVAAGGSLDDRIAGHFDWASFWTSARTRGYEFRPLADRVAHVRVRGVPGAGAQRWDPRSGDRVALETRPGNGGEIELDVAFTDGSMAVVVLAQDLPEPTRTDPEGEPRVQDLSEGWQVEARSTLDNRWGDVGDPADRGIVPIGVWQLEHARSETAGPPPAGGWQPALATFGPYLRVTGPHASGPGNTRAGAQWQPYEMSLSRGIRKDPLHFANLGPKGTVPEEFLRWERVPAGEWVAFAAVVQLPDGTGRRLLIGAPGERQAFLDDIPVSTDGSGYWTGSAVPDGAGSHRIEVWLRAPERRPEKGAATPTDLRATFAVVTDLSRARRPEWLEPAAEPGSGGRTRFTAHVQLEEMPADTRIQVCSEGPCSIVVNGTEIGRQGAFEPYQAQRRPQVMPYDLRPVLRRGDNEITVGLDDLGSGVALLVDSAALADGGLGVVSDLGWTGSRDGSDVGLRLRREQWTDPRWVCLWPRPHPLPRAAWLDPASASHGVVLDLVPDAFGDGSRSEWLRFVGPAGATSLRVPAAAPFTAWVDGRQIAPRGDRLSFDPPLPAGTGVALHFLADGGHRGGGLLEGPIEATVAPVGAPLWSWRELGFGSLAGEVSYRRTVHVGVADPGSTVVLDLGEVRGSVEVRVGGRRVASLVWSPYRVDLSAHLRPGANNVEILVRGTLAGYLEDASPTPAVHRGQTLHGLFGPVRLLHFGMPGQGGPMGEPVTAGRSPDGGTP